MILERFKVPPQDQVLVSEAALRLTTAQIFEKLGVTPEDAADAADVLTMTDLRGVETHGVSNMLRAYVRDYRAGKLDPRPGWTIEREAPGTAVIDAGKRLGIIVGPKAMRLAIEKARKVGVGIVTVHNSGHFGAIGHFAMQAAQADMVGVCFTAAGLHVVPTFGAKPLLGTNPIAVAAPAKEEMPFVLDMATAAIAFERLRVYASRGEKIPPGWAIDRQGNPVEDPRKVNEGGFLQGGALLPAGGYKGFGLSVMVNILTGVLMGGAYMEGLSEFAPYDTPERDSFLLGAVDIDHFIPYDAFVERMDDLIRRIKDCERAPGVAQIYLPGEQGFLRERERRKSGMPLDGPTADALRQLARELGIPPVPEL